MRQKKPSRTFAGIPQKYARKDSASIYIKSIPYDGTSTWGKGADKGFTALLEAAENMELYDIETDSEVYKKGIYILGESPTFETPEEMYDYSLLNTRELLHDNKFLTFIGGEHSISIGLIQAYYEQIDNLTVLQLDAHADLRPIYKDTPYNHACAMHDVSKNCNLVQVGIRSMDISEKEYMNYDKTYFAHEIKGSHDWIQDVINNMTDDVYITIDLDVFDSSIMPATGTPEPGGMDWYSVTRLLKETFMRRNVVAFDMVELAPIEGIKSPQYLAAKLYYKMLSYKFAYGKK